MTLGLQVASALLLLAPRIDSEVEERVVKGCEWINIDSTVVEKT